MLEIAIQMKEIKDKLLNVRFDDDVDDILREFCIFLSPRLNDKLVPIGFIVGCELALYDLQEGVSGLDKQPIRNRLVGYPSVIYNIIRMRIPDITDAVCPKGFASEIKSILKSPLYK